MLLCLFPLSVQAGDFDSLLDNYLAGWWKANPAGAATPAGVHTNDSQLEDFSPPAIQAEIARNRDFLRQFQQLDAKSMPAAKRADLEMTLDHIQLTLLQLEQIQTWKRDPQLYVSVLRDAVLSLIKREFAPADRRFTALAARLKLFPRVAAQARLNLQNPPELFTRQAMELADRTAELLEKDVPEAAATQGAGKKLQRRVAEESSRAAAAVRQFSKWLQTDLLPRSKGSAMAGAGLYRRAFRYWLETSLGPDEVLAEAERQLGPAQQQMRAVASGIAPGRPLPEVLAELAGRHPDPLKFVPAFGDAAAQLRHFVEEKRLAPLPLHDQLRVLPAPEFYHAGAPFLDAPGPFEPDLPSYYYVPSLDDFSPGYSDQLLYDYNNFTILLTGMREIYPGSYVQREMMNRTPNLARKVFASRAFLDGWAHYAEQMMIEEQFPADPAVRLFQLAGTLRRALDAVVDIRLHTGQISPSAAVQLLMDEGFLPKPAAEREVQFILLNPARSCSYFAGKLEILRLREELRRQQGPAFVLSEFHEHLLELGAPPVHAARELLLEEK